MPWLDTKFQERHNVDNVESADISRALSYIRIEWELNSLLRSFIDLHVIQYFCSIFSIKI